MRVIYLIYRRRRKPDAAMPSQTTYRKCYFEIKNVKREQPIVHKNNVVLPAEEKFSGKTFYKESFLPCKPEPVPTPFIPNSNIVRSGSKMLCDTTNKVGQKKELL